MEDFIKTKVAGLLIDDLNEKKVAGASMGDFNEIKDGCAPKTKIPGVSMEDLNETKVAGINGEILSFSGLLDCKEKKGSSLLSSSSSSSGNNSESSTTTSESFLSKSESDSVNLDCKSCVTDLKLDTLINVGVCDLCDYSEINFNNDSHASEIICHAVDVFATYAQWNFFYCCLCNNKFLDAESHIAHMFSKHLPSNSTDNIILLPISVQRSATRWSLDWKEPSLAWFKFIYDNDYNPNCFTKRIETSKCSDKRTRLLKRIGQSFDSLLSHDLSTDHLARLIERTTDYFLGGLMDEKLVVAKDILDQSSQLPFGMLDENCLKLVLKRLEWLEGLFIRQSTTTQDCNEFEVVNDDFLNSISLDETCTVLRCDPTKLSPVPEPPTGLQLPWTNTKMHENFSKVFEQTKSQVHLLNTKFENKKELLRNWDFVIILERILFKEGSRSSIQSSLEDWRDKLSQTSSGSRQSFTINFISDVLQKSRQSHKPIEVIFRELKNQRILDKLDVLDVQISYILTRLAESKRELCLVCAFDYRMSFLPFLPSFIRANIKSKSNLTLPTENQSTKMAIKTPFMNNKVEPTDKTVAFFSSLSEEKKKELFSVAPRSIYDYCYYHLESPWLGKEVFNAAHFFTLHKTWRFFSCISCFSPFPDEQTYIKHLASKHFSIPYWGWLFRPEPIAETRLAKVLLYMDWTPIDVPRALEVFAEISPLHECKDYAFLQWPIVKDDKRTKRLNLLKEHVHTLLQQKPSILYYAHLQTMIDLASEQSFGQFIPTRHRSIFNRILRHSPVCFRFMDSKSLGRLVVHFSMIRKITKSYLDSAYEKDSESEDYDSERDTYVMSRRASMYKDTENDFLWKDRENIDAVSFDHNGSFSLDLTHIFPQNDESLLSWVLDAPAVSIMPEFLSRNIVIFGLVRDSSLDVEEAQNMAYEMQYLHYYMRYLEEYTCFKRWMQLFGSSSGEKYDGLIMRAAFEG